MRIMGLNPEQVRDADAVGIGNIAAGDDGKCYIFVKAGGVIAKGDALGIDADGVAVPLGADNGLPGGRVGVAAAALAIDQHGWAQVYGRSAVNAAADCAAHTALRTTAADGQLDDADENDTLRGIVLTEACVAVAAVTACMLNWPEISG